MVRLLIIEPGYCPYIANFDNIESAIREVIPGTSQLTLPFDTAKIGMLCSENAATGLSREQADRYSRKYFLPESTLQDGDFPIAKAKPMDERFGRKVRFWER